MTPTFNVAGIVFRCSQHACVRIDERDIPDIMIDLLLQYGDWVDAGRSYSRVHFSDKCWNSLPIDISPRKKSLKRFQNVYLIVAGDGTIATVARSH